MKLTIDIPDAIMPDLKAIAVEATIEPEFKDPDNPTVATNITPEVEDEALLNYLRSCIYRGFKPRLLSKELSSQQVKVQNTVNKKLLQIQVKTG